MQIELTEIKRYAVKIDGVNLGEFKKVSSWEGMIKLAHKDGGSIIAEDESFADKLLEFCSPDSPKVLVVHKISPSLMAKVVQK